MPLIIEDGSIVPNANSYITVVEYQTWANERFGDSRATLPQTEAEYEAIILRGMDAFEANNFKGTIVQQDQPLQWPRYNVYIDGYLVPSNSIPKEVKTSVYEYTYAQETGNGELNTIGREVKKQKAGSVEVEYQDNASSTVINPAVSNSLRKLIINGGGLRIVRV